MGLSQGRDHPEYRISLYVCSKKITSLFYSLQMVNEYGVITPLSVGYLIEESKPSQSLCAKYERILVFPNPILVARICIFEYDKF